MIKSKFKLWALLPPFLSIIVIGLLWLIISKLFFNSLSKPPFVVYYFLVIFIFILLWLVFSELRTKALAITIEENRIEGSNFLGLGISKWYDFKELKGFKTSSLLSLWGRYEFLYLIRDNKKVIKISEFYHQNYNELKQILLTKVKNLGLENYSLIRDLKEMFL
jgi:hypothetical protein